MAVKKTLKDFNLSSKDLATLKKLKEEHDQKTKRAKEINPYSQSWNWLCENTRAFNPTYYPITVLISESGREWYAALTDASYSHIEMMDVLKIRKHNDDPIGFIKARLSWDLKSIDVCNTCYNEKGEFCDTPIREFEELIKLFVIPEAKKHVNVSHNYIDNWLLVTSDEVKEIPHVDSAYSPYAETFESSLRNKFNVKFKGDCGLFD